MSSVPRFRKFGRYKNIVVLYLLSLFIYSGFEYFIYIYTPWSIIYTLETSDFVGNTPKSDCSRLGRA